MLVVVGESGSVGFGVGLGGGVGLGLLRGDESGGVGFGVGGSGGVGLGLLRDERMFGCRRRNRWRGSAAWDSASAKAASAAICFNISGDSGTVSASPSRGILVLSDSWLGGRGPSRKSLRSRLARNLEWKVGLRDLYAPWCGCGEGRGESGRGTTGTRRVSRGEVQRSHVGLVGARYNGHTSG